MLIAERRRRWWWPVHSIVGRVVFAIGHSVLEAASVFLTALDVVFLRYHVSEKLVERHH